MDTFVPQNDIECCVVSLRAMSSLYSDPQWSANVSRAVSRLSAPGFRLEQALAWLDKRGKEEGFSLTDIWGVLTSAGTMKQVRYKLTGQS